MPRGNQKRRRWSHSKLGRGWKINQYFVHNNKTCALCGGFMRFEEVSIDHTIPLAQGGADHASNAQLAHIECNNKKGGECDGSERAIPKVG